jgi:flap endonuclease-1
MGIKNFTKFLKKYTPKSIKITKISDYKNKVIGIDANHFLYKLIFAIRARGYDIIHDNKKVTHLHALILKLYAFEKYNITPIFVYDGEPHYLKDEELKNRDEKRKEYINKLETKNNKTDDDKRKLYYLNTWLTQEEIDETQELIKLFGYTVINSKTEADITLAQLSKENKINYIVSDDPDILFFGGKNILKNFNISNKPILQLELKKILKESKLSFNDFIYYGILLGCDYCKNISVSPVKAYNMIINKDINKANLKDAYNYFTKQKKEKIIFENYKYNKNNLLDFIKKYKLKNIY